VQHNQEVLLFMSTCLNVGQIPRFILK